MLIIPALYASETYQENAEPLVYSLSSITRQDEIRIPENEIIFYSNPNFPTNLMKCKKLSGEGTIYIDAGNELVVHANDIVYFKGHIYCEQFARCTIYTKSVNNVAFTLSGDPILLIESDN